VVRQFARRSLPLGREGQHPGVVRKTTQDSGEERRARGPVVALEAGGPGQPVEQLHGAAHLAPQILCGVGCKCGQAERAWIEELVRREFAAPAATVPTLAQATLLAFTDGYAVGARDHAPEGADLSELTAAAEGAAITKGYLSKIERDHASASVATLVRRNLGAGDHVIAWDGLADGGRKPGAGVYFIVVRALGEQRSARVVVLP